MTPSHFYIYRWIYIFAFLLSFQSHPFLLFYLSYLLFLFIRFLVTWIKENQILEQLYGNNLHIELIKRSVDLAKFMAQMGQLDFKYLDLIWDASSVSTRAIDLYSLLSSLSCLPSLHSRFFFFFLFPFFIIFFFLNHSCYSWYCYCY